MALARKTGVGVDALSRPAGAPTTSHQGRRRQHLIGHMHGN